MLSVTAADREGARRLTGHLIAAGHEQIAFVMAAVPWPMLEQRLLGYRDALAVAGLKPHVYCYGGWNPLSAADHADRMLAGPRPPTAIMCGNDLLALGAIRAVRQRGLGVPEDIAITGFDDFEFAEYAEPALTTVRIPGYDIGRTAGELLVDVLEGRPPARRQFTLPVELKLRESA